MKDFAQRAGLLADVGHFEKQRRENAAGAGQGDRQAVAAGDGVADAGEIRADPAAGHVGLALPRAADVDAGIGLDRQPMAQLGEGLVRELGLEKHAVVRCPWSVVRCHMRSGHVCNGPRTTDNGRLHQLWRICVHGHGIRPDSPPCRAGFVLGLGQAAFHDAAVAIIEPGVGQAGSNQLFVEHHVAVPDERQETVVAVLAFQAEREPHAVAGFFDEILGELAGFRPPGFDRMRLASRFRAC